MRICKFRLLYHNVKTLNVFGEKKIAFPGMQPSKTQAPVIPRWLTRRSVSTVVRPDSCSLNQHGILTADHINVKWPLPTVFGAEDYGYSLIDMPDKRYEKEAALMSAKLIRLFYDKQIIEYEWQKAYKNFVKADTCKANLTPSVLEKSREKAEKEFVDTKEQLLRLQDQRDLFNDLISQIWDRCAEIKAEIKREEDLKELRDQLSLRVKEKYPPNDPFWKTEFSVHATNKTKKHKHF